MTAGAPPPIVTLTLNPCIDESAEVLQVVPDRKLRCGAPHYEPGGGGINVARAVCRLGGGALAVFPAGGAAGALLQALLEAEGVPQRPVPIARWTRQNLNVTETTTGRQFRFVLPGPRLADTEREACYGAVASRDPFPAYVVASGSLPPGAGADVMARLARLCRARGARFVLDTPGEDALAALEEGVFLFKPSLREFQNLARLTRADDAELSAEAQGWIRRGRCEIVLISLGPAGALVVTADGAERVLAPTVTVRSTVGAGDSMLAGVVLALSRGQAVAEAVRFGVAAGSAAVMNPGTELCRRDDAERLFATSVRNAGSSLVTA